MGLMLIGMFLFSAADMLAKLLTEAFPAVQIFWFRQLALLLGVICLLIYRGKAVLRSQRPGLQISRGALAVCSGLLFIYAVNYVPLADAVAATFVAPFFLTLLAAVVLHEKIGARRWSAVLVGFIGALIITRPGTGAVHPSVLLVIAAAAFYAARQVVGRVLSDTDSTLTTVCYTALTASAIVSLPLPWFWQWPTALSQWLLLLLLSVFAGVGEVLVIRALEVAEAAAVAPIHYTLIIWGTIYGYVIFNQIPDAWTWLGTVIIVLAGLYTLRRDRVASEQIDQSQD